jgi:hypothetical protein
MKKLGLIAVLVGLGVLAVYTVHAATVTNELGQVITTSTAAGGGITVTITDPRAPASVTNRTVDAQGCQLSMATDTTATDFTPRNYGDMLIGKEGGTGKVWVATGLTTADWKPVYDP